MSEVELNSGKDYIDQMLDVVKDRLSLSDHEVQIVKDVNLLLREPTPTVQAGIESRVSKIDQYRNDLTNLIYMIENKETQLDYDYHKIYDVEFTRLTRAGRPSQQAIESEIHSSIEGADDRRLVLRDIENFKNLLFGYLRALKSSKETCMKKWGYV